MLTEFRMISNANRDLNHEILNRIDDIHNGRPPSARACSNPSKFSTGSKDSVDSNNSIFSQASQVSQASKASTVDDLSPPPPFSEKWDLHLVPGEDPENDTLDLSQEIIDKIEEKDYKSLRKSLKAGQDPFGENDQGWCALHYAARKNSKTVMQELLAYEKLRMNTRLVDRRNIHGATALHFAASLGAKNSVKELIRFGADVNAMDGVRQSPLFVTVIKNREEVFEMLLNAGARFGPSIPKAAQRMLNNIADRKKTTQPGMPCHHARFLSNNFRLGLPQVLLQKKIRSQQLDFQVAMGENAFGSAISCCGLI